MKRLIIICLLIAIAAVGAALLINRTSIGISKTKIDTTATQVTRIRQISQWEFLTVECEVLVDTVRKRSFPLSDDRLARIYKGALRLGVNLESAADDWIEIGPDSAVTVTLPPIGLLDSRFIDEAATISFYEEGKWDAAAKEDMYRRAGSRMRAYALSPEFIAMAREQARSRFTSLFRAIGYDNVSVLFADRE